MVDNEADSSPSWSSRFDRWGMGIIAASVWVGVLTSLGKDDRSTFWFPANVILAVVFTLVAVYFEIRFRRGRGLADVQSDAPDDESPDETRRLTRTSPRRGSRDRGSRRGRT